MEPCSYYCKSNVCCEHLVHVIQTCQTLGWCNEQKATCLNMTPLQNDATAESWHIALQNDITQTDWCSVIRTSSCLGSCIRCNRTLLSQLFSSVEHLAHKCQYKLHKKVLFHNSWPCGVQWDECGCSLRHSVLQGGLIYEVHYTRPPVATLYSQRK